MNVDDKVPPMPDDVVDLLASVRALEAPPSDAAARLRARLVPPVVPPGGGGSVSAPSQVATLASWSRAPWWAVAAALIVGVGAGRLTAPAPKTIVQTVPVEIRSDVQLPAVAPEAPAPSEIQSATVTVGAIAALPSPAPSTVVARAATNAVMAEKSSGNLAAERRLLAVARTALGRSNGADAMASCDEHARQFPKGELAEEREAIAIQALVQSQRVDEARARANRFRQSYPKSILLPAVLASTEGER
ncbi:hypothetical protein AKJ09_06684 [Labilithrix luteola]|uniref:Outer membrane lipoprotein BamD-like domain-containing protein n=1 Tax=Labilithrix luteola TaxID=1391654 RepID=A0A0K1Q2I1_9BACT|nr:hypothetical protein [Labilithrix luteola]AKV00021.1 hypothetical protein AKJ09_06684 [Labilithrix luteola]